MALKSCFFQSQLLVEQQMAGMVSAQHPREGRGMLLALRAKTSSYTMYSFFVRFDFVLQLVPKYFGSVVSVAFILFFPWDVSIIRRSTSHKSRNFEIPLLYGLLL